MYLQRIHQNLTWYIQAGVPILGICYGLQLMGKMLGGEVKSSDRRSMVEVLDNRKKRNFV